MTERLEKLIRSIGNLSVRKDGYVFFAASLHRLVWVLHHQKAIPEGLVIHHINGDPSDNRIENLEAVTQGVNNALRPVANGKRRLSSNYSGVHWNKERGKYAAKISYEGRNVHLGLFQCEEAAKRAYDREFEAIYGRKSPNQLREGGLDEQF